MSVINKIQPAFLKKIDHYLLINNPVIWRTRVHYFLFYSLVVGNFIAFTAAVATPVKLDNVMRISNFDMTYVISMILMGFVAIFWTYSQVRYPLRSTRMIDIFKTLLLYAFSLVCLSTNVWTFQHVLIYKTANVVSNTEFQKDWQTIRANSVLQSYQHQILHDHVDEIYDVAQLDQEIIAPYMAVAEKYGVEKYDIYPSTLSELGEIRLHSYELNSIFISIESAKNYLGKRALNNKAFDTDAYYDHYYHSAYEQSYRFSEHAFTTGVLLAFIPGLLFLASLISFKVLLMIGAIEFGFLVGLGLLVERFNLDFPSILAVLFVGTFAVIMVYGKNSFWARLGLGLVFVTLPIMVSVGYYWDVNFDTILGDAYMAAGISLVFLTGLGKIIQGRIMEPKTGSNLL
ncbi:MAG: hypothetical protein AAF502_15135 [Bacteroidota bacterium]